MNIAPLITVLMPAYNVAPYISAAVKSVLRQSFTGFELLIIDDGSTDETADIIRSFGDTRIRIYRQENKGVIGALNKGLELACGQYVARFDADDICYPQRLEVQLRYMQEHPDCVLLGSAADYVDKDDEFLFEWQPPAYTHEALARLILKTAVLEHPTVMYPLATARKLGGYPRGAVHFEDHLFWTLFFSKGKVANLEEPLVRRRFNPASVTIDEKWRGPDFRTIKYAAITRGNVTHEEEEKLRALLIPQDMRQYKEAAYYSMIGKKYLWNNYQPEKARAHLRKAIAILPGRPAPYLLYLMSFLGKSFLHQLYQRTRR